MAAAWVRVLPVAEIPGEIERSLSFLSTAARDVAERQRSIHAVFDHSWQLLTERERSVLRQLAVFRNGFTREAAEAVAGASLLDLSALLDKSWLRLTSDGRYAMHSLAQQYALEKLHGGPGESAGDVLQRHCLFYAGLVPVEALFGGMDAVVPLAEIENVKLAWQTALEQRHWRALEQIAASIYVLVETGGGLGILPQLERTITQLDADLQKVARADDEQREAIETALVGFLYMAGEHHIHIGTIAQAIDYLSRGSRECLPRRWRRSC